MEAKLNLDHTIRTFVRRSRRMTCSQEVAYSSIYDAWCINFSSMKNEARQGSEWQSCGILGMDGMLDFRLLFGNEYPITCEVGFGSGDATALIAKNNPCKNYLCIEVFQAGIANLLTKIEKEKITNIRIIEGDAIEVLEGVVPVTSISAFHFFFPDPWQKKKHNKRRFLRRPRTELLQTKLISNGYIYMATDWHDYATEAFAELTATKGLFSRYDGFAPHQEWRPQTKFELRAIEAGRKIYEMIFEKKVN